MGSKASLALLASASTLIPHIYIVASFIVLFWLLQLIRRFPKAQIHRRWATAYFVGITLALVLRLYSDVRLFYRAPLPFYVTALTYTLGSFEELIWLYGHVQLWKAFRALARRYAAGLKDMPFEDWSESSRSKTNPWDVSQT